MKFTVNTKQLCSILHPIARDVAAKMASTPQLSFRVIPKDNYLVVRSANGTLDVTAAISVTEVAEVDLNPVFVPANALSDYIDHVSLKEIQVEVRENSIGIFAGNASAHLPIIDDTLPEIRKINGTPKNVKLKGSSFRDAIAALLPIAAVDSIRLQLQGIHLETRNGIIDVVSSDAHALLLEKIPAEDGTDDETSANIPSDVAKFLAKIIRDDDTVHLEIGEDGASARARIGDFVVGFPLVTAKYPDYRKILVAECPLTASVESSVFKYGLNVAQVNNVTDCVRLDFEGGILDAKVTFTSEHVFPGSSNKTTSTFPCEYSGESLAIIFSKRRLIDVVKALDCPKVEIQMKSSRNAAFFANAERADGDPDRFALLMPSHDTSGS